MARKAKELSALEVGRLKEAGHYAVGGVAGLYLFVNEAGARSWVLRFTAGDKRRHMGLGGFPDVPLAHAREKARQARDDISRGIDPIAQRKAAISKLRAQQMSEKTFKQAATAYIEAHGDTWKNAKHRAQWEATLKTYAYPIMGDLHVRDVGQEQVLKVLEPIWKTKNETASRVRGRIESVLDWATVRKHRSGENPARWKGHPAIRQQHKPWRPRGARLDRRAARLRSNPGRAIPRSATLRVVADSVRRLSTGRQRAGASAVRPV